MTTFTFFPPALVVQSAVIALENPPEKSSQRCNNFYSDSTRCGGVGPAQPSGGAHPIPPPASASAAVAAADITVVTVSNLQTELRPYGPTAEETRTGHIFC